MVKSLTFFKLLSELGYPRVVFSSSAAIYDVVPGFMVWKVPSAPAHAILTKYMMEMILKDFSHAYL